ncbi:MAG: hypothetical protein M3384_11625 [Acidobacteriota bacterium]|nr:hypothetical protein [Acidobacteriota bacterium]
MKNRLLCLCLVLSLCISANAVGSAQKNKIFSEAQTFQPNNHHQAAAASEIPNVFRPIGIFFKRLFGKRRGAVYCPPPASVRNLTLSKTEVFSSCPADGKSCSGNEQTIEIFTDGYDPENDVLTYNYNVSGGKIIGQGAKVVWDLSGAKPGTYTITAGVDDGCGVCGRTETKEVRVLECPNCN